MVLDIIKKRYSVRNFLNKDVPDELLHNILEAARLAPSWMNVQPRHFIVIKNQKTKELLSQLAHGQPHVAKAPVIIACCGDVDSWEKENFKEILKLRSGITEERINTLLSNPIYNPKVIGNDAVIYRTIEELTYSIAYMTLEASEQGLETCVVGAIGNELNGSIPNVYSEVRKTLNLPDNLMLIALLLVGYADTNLEVPQKQRKSFNKVISFESFGNTQ